MVYYIASYYIEYTERERERENSILKEHRQWLGVAISWPVAVAPAALLAEEEDAHALVGRALAARTTGSSQQFPTKSISRAILDTIHGICGKT